MEDLDMAMLDVDTETRDDRASVSFWITERRERFGYDVTLDRLVAGHVVLRPSGDLVITAIDCDGGLGGKALDYLRCAVETGKLYGTDQWVKWHSGRSWAERQRHAIRDRKVRFPK